MSPSEERNGQLTPTNGEGAGELNLKDAFESHLQSIADLVLKLNGDANIVELHEPEAANLQLTEGAMFTKYLNKKDTKAFSDALEEAGEKAIASRTVRLRSAKKQEWRVFELRIQQCVGSQGYDYLITGIDRTNKRRESQYRQVIRRVFRHNIRNDLNVVSGHANLIIDQPDETDPTSSAEVIEATTSQLLKIVNKIQKISKEVYLMDRDVYAIENKHLIEPSVDYFREQYPAVEFRTRINRAHFLGNELMKVAIENALENAIEHNSNERPIVTVLSRKSDSHKEVIIEIEDNGPGIPLGEIRAVQNGNEDQLEHTSGVGLWIIKWVVEGLYGSVSFNPSTRFATGTTVKMRLPLADVESPL